MLVLSSAIITFQEFELYEISSGGCRKKRKFCICLKKFSSACAQSRATQHLVGSRTHRICKLYLFETDQSILGYKLI